MSGAAEDVRKLIDVDVFAIEIGYGLLGLADSKNGGELLGRVTGVRKSLAREKGIVVPPVSVALTVTVAGTPGRLNPEAVAASFVSATVIVVAAVIVGLAESVTLTV